MSDPVNVQEAVQAAGSLGAVLVWAHYFLLPELKRMREAVEANTAQDGQTLKSSVDHAAADKAHHEEARGLLTRIAAKAGVLVVASVLLLSGCSLSPAVRDTVGAWRSAWQDYDASSAPIDTSAEAVRARDGLRLELEGALRDVERAAQ